MIVKTKAANKEMKWERRWPGGSKHERASLTEPKMELASRRVSGRRQRNRNSNEQRLVCSSCSSGWSRVNLEINDVGTLLTQRQKGDRDNRGKCTLALCCLSAISGVLT